MSSADWRDLRIIESRIVADDVLELRIADPAGALLPPWEPGAHLEIRTGSGIRQYSLCGRPDDTFYTIAILRETDGRGGSADLHARAVVGTELEVRGPRNHFALLPHHDDHVLIAGGIGITPIAAMAHQLQASGRRWQLHYGGRTLASMAYVDELVALAPEAVQVTPQDSAGLLDVEAILADLGPDTVVYCCGPTGLLEACIRAMTGDRADRLHVERFTGEPTDHGPQMGQDHVVRTDDVFVVELAASGQEVTVMAGQSILEAVRQQLPDVASSCEDGYCGTCETRVLAGTPLHRDSVLTPSEQDSGEMMMICVSRSLTPRLVLDL